MFAICTRFMHLNAIDVRMHECVFVLLTELLGKFIIRRSVFFSDKPWHWTIVFSVFAIFYTDFK